MVWLKCTISAECKTIRIAESSVMDSWKALLRPMCKALFSKNGGVVDIIPKDRYEEKERSGVHDRP